MTLLPCPGCSRHVRPTEPTCPFCAHALPSAAVVAVDGPTAGPAPSRHAVMFGVAAGAIAVSTALFGSACAAYGGPTADANPPDAATSSADAGR